MSGLNVGLSTFASCNKAGSIPHFTRHLQSYPYDFEALMWRGRAYSIINQPADALDDFRRAETFSRGPQKYLAESIRASMEGNAQKSIEVLIYAVKAYPECGEVWSEIGSKQFYAKKHDDALPTLMQAIDLGKQNSETQRPWYYWSNQHVGDIYYTKHQVPNAEPYYNTAVTSCNTFTIAHLGISRCNIINKNIPEAKIRFQTARSLNPKLVHWGNFAEFEQDVISDFYKSNTFTGQHFHDEATSSLESRFSSVSLSGRPASTSGREYSDSGRCYGGKRGRNSGSGGGGHRDRGGNGGGSDGEDDDDFVLKLFAKASTLYKRHNDGRKFTKIGDSEYWLTRDKAGHGSSFFKVFVEKGNTMDFIGSVTKRIFHEDVIRDLSYLKRILHHSPRFVDFNLIPKHESHKGEQIKMKDLNK